METERQRERRREEVEVETERQRRGGEMGLRWRQGDRGEEERGG